MNWKYILAGFAFGIILGIFLAPGPPDAAITGNAVLEDESSELFSFLTITFYLYAVAVLVYLVTVFLLKDLRS
ncbi:hypothetical protein GF323_02905 [Candidatus Woesearchaeota archaeon]|nr:hypothetical protein [Candidatus Woesearchaeota archaeon]